MRKLPLRTIFVPIIIVAHFIPFYYLTMKYNESPQLQEEEAKNEEVKEESVEFEEEEIEEIPEEEYTSPQELAAVNELINNKPKTEEIQQLHKKNVHERAQTPPANHELYAVNTQSSVSGTRDKQPAGQTLENRAPAQINNCIATYEEYQKYYEGYINEYSLNGKEDGLPHLILDVPDSEQHREILIRMGFRLIIRPHSDMACEPDPSRHTFHIAVTGSGMEKRNGLPTGFALGALSHERKYYLEKIKDYPWYREISDIPLEIVYYPEKTVYTKYIMGKMTRVVRDCGVRQQDVLALIGVIKRTVSGRFILIVSEIHVRDDRGYRKLQYLDKDESRFRFVSQRSHTSPVREMKKEYGG